MATLGAFPPNAENAALFINIRGFRQTAAPVIAVEGPEGHLGPESAGAVLFLHMTMVDDERAQQFYRQVAVTFEAASQAPGFIRLMAFFDGFTNNVLAFWRTLEDAQSFAKTRSHLEAVQDMYAKNFEYTHFAGLFEAVGSPARFHYCDVCGREHKAPVDRCAACGNELINTFEHGALSEMDARPKAADQTAPAP